VAISVFGWACSSGNDAPSCPANNPECKDIATVAAGKEAVVKRKCVQCHGDNMAGSTTAIPSQPTALGEAVELYPPNLTGDPDTGVAKWTDDALALAIREGIDNESQHLCPQMNHFAQMSDFEVYSIVKYLRSLPPVKQEIPSSICPPEKTKAQ
jgi:mono/diheme cytochrome c family protein